jgi:hypothetical protein
MRLENGRCPVHGLWMSQIDSWYYPEDGVPFTLVGCPRGDCAIYARAYGFDGPWELPDEFASLLVDTLPDPKYQIPRTRPPRKRKAIGVDREAIWKKTGGKCCYCGSKLTRSGMTIDHLHPVAKGGRNDLANLVPACRSCNSSKGTKSVEEFRFFRRMQEFEAINGVAFSEDQVNYLVRFGIELPIPGYEFWFEVHEPD